MIDPDEASTEQLWEALPGATGRDRGDILMRLGLHLDMAHDHEGGLACAEEAAEVFLATGAMRDRGMALTSVAFWHMAMGDFAVAIENFDEATRLFTQHGEPRDLLPVYEGLSDAHRNLNHWDETLAAAKTLDALVRDVDWSPHRYPTARTDWHRSIRTAAASTTRRCTSTQRPSR